MTYTDRQRPSETRAPTDFPREITLGMTRSMAEGLQALSQELDAPVEEVLSQAVGLLMVAVEAQKRGERICLADDDLNIKGEIVDFGSSSERVGIDPFPEAESDRLDP